MSPADPLEAEPELDAAINPALREQARRPPHQRCGIVVGDLLKVEEVGLRLAGLRTEVPHPAREDPVLLPTSTCQILTQQEAEKQRRRGNGARTFAAGRKEACSSLRASTERTRTARRLRLTMSTLQHAGQTVQVVKSWHWPACCANPNAQVRSDCTANSTGKGATYLHLAEQRMPKALAPRSKTIGKDERRLRREHEQLRLRNPRNKKERVLRSIPAHQKQLRKQESKQEHKREQHKGSGNSPS